MKSRPSNIPLHQQDRAIIEKHRSTCQVIFETLQSPCFLPPEPHPWEDFLDFSRFVKLPNDRRHIVAKRRILTNVFHRFCGNYVWIWFLTVITTGAWLERPLLIASTLSLFSWFLLCLLVTWATPRKKAISSKGQQQKERCEPLFQESKELKITLLRTYQFMFLFGN